jgi:FkbM family methyltransferase
MLIDANTLKNKFGVNPKGILHVGAHLGEEYGLYVNAGWFCPIIWVEGQTELAVRLKSFIPTNHKVINAIVWDLDDIELNFKLTNNSQSSSLFDFGTHQFIYQDVFVNKIERVKTKRLDSFIESNNNIDLLVLDIQGAELKALIGLGKHLKRVNYVYSEVNKKEVYKDCALVKDLDRYLKNFGFKRVATSWVVGAGWGDALWIKTDLINTYLINIVLFKLREFKKLILLKNKSGYLIRLIKIKLKRFSKSSC